MGLEPGLHDQRFKDDDTELKPAEYTEENAYQNAIRGTWEVNTHIKVKRSHCNGTVITEVITGCCKQNAHGRRTLWEFRHEKQKISGMVNVFFTATNDKFLSKICAHAVRILLSSIFFGGRRA